MVLFGFRPVACNTRADVRVELGISIQDGVALRGGCGERFSELLEYPLHGRVPGDVERPSYLGTGKKS